MLRELERNIQLLLARGLARILGVRVKGATEVPTGTSVRPSFSLIEALGGKSTHTGIRISPETAHACAAVYKCVRLLSETLANLPLFIYERLPDGKEVDVKHPLHSLLHDAPNERQTSFEWREMNMGHLCLRGNGYAGIERNGRGEVIALKPWHPDRTGMYETPDGSMRFYYNSPQRGPDRMWPEDDVLHLRGMSSDGTFGLSPVSLLREPIALALAGEEFAGRLFKNGARLSGFLKVPEAMDEEEALTLEQKFRERRAGLQKVGGIAVFDTNMEWTQIGMSSQDAEILSSRKWEALNLYGVFGVPPHMVGETEKATSWGTGIEQQTIGFVTFTMLAWCRRHEQRYNLALLTPEERSRYFIEFKLDQLARGDLKSRYAAYAVGRQWGWLSVNDIRRLENMNPIEGGDVYLQPLNMVEAGTIDERRLIDQAGEASVQMGDFVYAEVHGKTRLTFPQAANKRFSELRAPMPAMAPERMQAYFDSFRAA